MRYFARRIVGPAAVLLTLGLGPLLMANPAYAGNGTQAGNSLQWCLSSNQCINAWFGGPQVNTYTPNVANNDFRAINDADNMTALQFQGNGECIGDYGNSSTNARAGLNNNCAGGTVAWGTNLQASTCPGGVEFYDLHWKGYLGPATTSGNGVAFYLNKPTPYCFTPSSF
jgi:hypothetical protein